MALIDVDMGTAPTSNLVDVDMTPKKPEGLLSTVGRGFKESFQQVPQLAYGLGAGVAAAAENVLGEGGVATAAKHGALAGMKRWQDKIAEHTQENDSIDTAWDKAKTGDVGALVDWLAHGIGYVGGQGLQVLATSGIGYAAGKVTAVGAAKAIASGMIEKETARLTAETGGKIAADVLAKEAAANVAGRIGSTVAIGAHSVGQEGGEIFGDLAEKNKDRALTGAELGRAFGATLVAGGLEFLGEKLGLDAAMGKLPVGKTLAGAPGLMGRAGRGATAAAIAAPLEGATEFGQTLVEEYGKGNEDTVNPFAVSDATLKHAREAAALGALGGAAIGGVAAAVPSPKKILEAPDVDSAIEAFRFDLDPNRSAGVDFKAIAQTYKDHTPEQIASSQDALHRVYGDDPTFTRAEDGTTTAYGAPLRVVPPQALPPMADGQEGLSRDGYEAIAALNEAQGKRTVVYEHHANLPDGLVRQPDVVFISNKTTFDPVVVATHEAQHLSEQGELQAQYAKVVQEELTANALELAHARHDERDAAGVAIPMAEGQLHREIRADIAGDAWADPAFHGRVLDQLKTQIGAKQAADTANTFLASIRELIGRVKAVLTGTTFTSPDGQRLATQYVTNLERVQDALAAAIAERFLQSNPEQVERERSKLEAMRGRTAIGRTIAEATKDLSKFEQDHAKDSLTEMLANPAAIFKAALVRAPETGPDVKQALDSMAADPAKIFEIARKQPELLKTLAAVAAERVNAAVAEKPAEAPATDTRPDVEKAIKGMTPDMVSLVALAHKGKPGVLETIAKAMGDVANAEVAKKPVQVAEVKDVRPDVAAGIKSLTPSLTSLADMAQAGNPDIFKTITKVKAEVAKVEAMRKPKPVQKSPKSPEFDEWFGDSKAVDKEGAPLTLAHATNKDISEFKPGVTWLGEPGFANAYAKAKFGYWKNADLPWEQDAMIPTGVNIMPLHARIERPFDFSPVLEDLGSRATENEVAAVAKALGINPSAIKLPTTRTLSDGRVVPRSPLVADILTTPAVLEVLRARGHDGFTATEDGHKVWAVLNPNQVKSVLNDAPTSGNEIMKSARAQKDKRTGVALTKAERFASLDEFLYGDRLPYQVRTQVELGALLEEMSNTYATKRDEDTPENREFVAHVVEHEARLALSQEDNAVGWYGKTTDAALRIAALIHPEIATDQNARFAFTYALAVTSNGTTIAENTRSAHTIYKSYVKNGRMPEIGFGVRVNNMKIALRTWNDIAGKIGVPAFREFMLTMRPVKELKAAHPSIRELITDSVYGGTIIGPKIGGAFLQNLNGNHDAIAMDRWFMRTWGRITGNLVTRSKGIEVTRDAPGSGGERHYIRAAMRIALERLRSEHPSLTMSDLQALLWYPEKDLYTMHGVSDESGKPTDYEIEGAKYARLAGIDADAIEQARRLQPDEPAGRGAGDQLESAPGLDSFQASPKRVQRGGGRGGRSLAEAQRVAAQAAGQEVGLLGVPVAPMQIAGDWYVPGPVEAARRAAAAYMAGRGYAPVKQYLPVDTERAKRIAAAFDEMRHDPQDPEVKAAYRAMIDETNAQWQAIKATGLKVEFIKAGDPDPYAVSPRLAIQDVVDNNHLWVFPTDSGFGSDNTDVSDNPLLELTDETIGGHQLRANDVFRIVHDYFGHIKDGNGFRAGGEENAWRSHAAMYTPLARRAMTSETRGQNSWVNFGPYGAVNQTASAADTHYAPQKIGLLPEWVSEAGAGDTITDDGQDRTAAQPGDITDDGQDRTAAQPGDDGRDGSKPLRSPKRGEIAVTAVHYAGERRDTLDGSKYGRGAKGAEAERISTAPDARLRSRVYAYVNTGNGITPEKGVGGVPHVVQMQNLYDADSDPLNLASKDANDFESAVLDAGFDGYLTRGGHQGVAVLIGPASSAVPAEDRGLNLRTDGLPVPAAPVLTAGAQAARAFMADKSLPDGQMTGANWMKLVPGVALNDGEMYYKSDVAQKVAAEAGARDALDNLNADATEQEQDDAETALRTARMASPKQLPAPNGKPSKLPEHLHALVRTPAFKAWFGDWEKFATVKGGVWSDTEKSVSKVVDENGEPLVVYHGTTAGGFTEFSQDASKKERATFFTDDPRTARTYSGTSRKVDLSEVDEDGYVSEQVGLYVVFLNIRGPNEAHFEGANWDGTRVDQYEVVEGNDPDDFDAEKMYDEKGNGFFSRDEAEALAEAKGGSVRPADGVFETTDGIVRDAIRHGNDGAIIHQVTDPGPHGDAYDPVTVYAVLNANQIKSVDNRGTFDAREDSIMKSPKIVGASKRPYTPAQQKFFTNTGRTINPPTIAERIAALRKDFGKKMAQGLVDQFAPLKELSPMAYMLARLSKGTAGAVEALLRHGKLRLSQSGAYDGDQSGGFVETVAIPLQGEMEDFFWWVAAHRAEQLSAEDRERLFSRSDIAAGKTLADGTLAFDYTLLNGRTTRSRREAFADTLAKYDAFNKNVMDMAEQSGLVNRVARASWEKMMYVPFYRVSEEDGSFVGGGMSNSLVRQRAFKHLRGGTDKLNSDLLANVLSNWAHLIDASAKNRAAKSALDAAVNTGIAVEADAATVKSMASSVGKKSATVWFMDDGAPRHFLVDDPFVMTAITSLEYAGMRGPIMDAMSAFKHVLTVGVTASPHFKIKNLIRDSLQAVATSPIGYNVAANLKEGIAASDKSTQTYVSALASGGLIRFGTMLEGRQADRVRQLTRAGIKDSTILNSDSKLRAVYDKFIDPAIAAYNELGNRSEEINRSALYKQLTDKGMDHGQAALMARDLMDFSLQGAWTGIRFLTQVVPFMNARMQGLYKLGRAAGEDPKRFAAVLAATSMFSLALLAAYSDDDDWKKREDWDRDNFWWFKMGGVAFRIPKPFEIGAVATLAERGVELFTDKEMTGERFTGRVMKLLGDNLSMNPTPQLIKPLIDLYANKDSFTGRPIETMSMERLQPDYRFTGRTSMLARAASTAGQTVTSTVGGNFLSPVQIDHVLKGYFAWLGSFIIGTAETIAQPRALAGEPTQPAGDLWKTVTGNMISELPADQSRYVSHMYEQAEVLERAMGTYRMLAKTGKTDEAATFLEANRDKLMKYRKVEHVKAAETKLNERIRIIERSAMEPDAKKAAIAAINAQKDQVARLVK